ncbi:DUF2167 domain-containing protein [Deinococcus aquiradiocola]|uniref:DUF2167 domain-containing protein n=1 Tax=Deinococcus aquiradiocola TaxID=393059 RepID=A0A917UU26_9DEIO|nr:DUF2167 domain-containing protein [Deinococcus aquiradiocola]GGJ85172.1 hypothetical protein GCM10008939_31370 [Deinococcus aquiradiocola]
MKKVLLLCAFLTGSALAATPTLHGQTGTIPVLGGKVTVQATPTLRHLNAADARTVIVDEWGNPPEAADDVLGLLVPGGTTPGAQDSWAIVMTENRDGHVSDADAARTDYADLLRGMQDRVQEGNAERVKAGDEPITLVGWAEPPSYDAAQHKMIWAKELAFGTAGRGDHTLNYAVRVLSRDDVLELNAVGAASQLVQIRQVMQSVLPNVTFTAGHRYEDYSEGRRDRGSGGGRRGRQETRAAGPAAVPAQKGLDPHPGGPGPAVSHQAQRAVQAGHGACSRRCEWRAHPGPHAAPGHHPGRPAGHAAYRGRPGQPR